MLKVWCIRNRYDLCFVCFVLKWQWNENKKNSSKLKYPISKQTVLYWKVSTLMS